MIICLLASLFFGGLVIWTGPACEGPRTRLMTWRNYPKAKALPKTKQKGLLVEGSVSVGSPLS